MTQAERAACVDAMVAAIEATLENGCMRRLDGGPEMRAFQQTLLEPDETLPTETAYLVDGHLDVAKLVDAMSAAGMTWKPNKG